MPHRPPPISQAASRITAAALFLYASALAACGGGSSYGLGGGGGPYPSPSPSAHPSPSPNQSPTIFYTASGNAIFKYSLSANGTFTQQAEITGPNTGLTTAYGVALDSAGNVYAVNNSGQSASITEYAAGSNGDAAPVSTIQGPNTQLFGPYGIALDGLSNIYVANNSGNYVTEYAAGTNGDVSPISMISGPMLGAPMGIAIDESGNIFVTHGIANGGANAALEYAPGANGTPAPIALIPGSDGAAGVAPGGPSGYIYVSVDGISEFAPPTVGNMYGRVGNVGLAGTLGAALDSAGRVFVVAGGNFSTSTFGNTIEVFNSNLAGGTALYSLSIGAWGIAVQR